MRYSRGLAVRAALMLTTLASSAVVSHAWAAPANRVIVQPGEDFLLSIYTHKFAEHAAELRAAWQAAHPNTKPDATLPSVTGGSIKASTLTVGVPGEYPQITFSYQTGTSGLRTVYFIFTSPSGQSSYFAAYGPPTYTTSGTVSYEQVIPVSLWSQPGKWTLTSVQIEDGAGNNVFYTKAQVAALFPQATYTVVNNGTYDSIAPTIVGGGLSKTPVSLSATYPTLTGFIRARDSGSGLLQGYIYIQPPGATYEEYEDVPREKPAAVASVNIDTVFAPNDTTGTWSILAYVVCDYAMNCSGNDTPAAVTKLLGTNTFTVTP